MNGGIRTLADAEAFSDFHGVMLGRAVRDNPLILSGADELLGAEAIELPAIRIEPLPVDDKRINETFDRFLEDDYSLICFTSANGVSCFFDLLAGASMDARDLAGIDIAVIGPGTARALAEHGIKAVIQPGGSMRDAEVVAAADEHGIAMVFTGMRHFRH